MAHEVRPLEAERGNEGREGVGELVNCEPATDSPGFGPTPLPNEMTLASVTWSATGRLGNPDTVNRCRYAIPAQDLRGRSKCWFS
jgi:hypothetical protein